MGWSLFGGHTVVFNDGRLVMTYTDRAGKPKAEIREAADRAGHEGSAYSRIQESGCRDHDHSKAKLAHFSQPRP